MNHTSINIALMRYIDDVSPKLKFQIFYSNAMDSTLMCWGQKRLRRNYHPKILGDRISERDSKNEDVTFVKYNQTRSFYEEVSLKIQTKLTKLDCCVITTHTRCPVAA